MIGSLLMIVSCAGVNPRKGSEASLGVEWKEARRILAESKTRAVEEAPEKRGVDETAHREVAKASVEDAETPVTVAKRQAYQPSRSRFHPARTTAYFHGEADHLAYGCKSALGSDLRYGQHRSAAADWSRYPLGTRFRIVGDRHACEYRIDDYGKALVGTNTIDLYKPTNGAMMEWGVREVVIEIIEWGSFDESMRIMKPRKRSSHVRRMVEAIESRNSPGIPDTQIVALASGDS